MDDNLYDAKTQRTHLPADNLKPGRQFIAVVLSFWRSIHNHY